MIANGGGTWTVDPERRPTCPSSQSVPTTGAPGAARRLGADVAVAGQPGCADLLRRHGVASRTSTTPGVDHDHIIAGTYHDATGAGKVTFIGGHSFSTSLPYSTNAEAPYLRAFYNSLFFNGSAVAKLDLQLSPASFPQNGTGLLSASVVNVGASKAVGARRSHADDAARLHLRLDDHRPEPDRDGQPATTGQTLTWTRSATSTAARRR